MDLVEVLRCKMDGGEVRRFYFFGENSWVI